MTHLEIVSLSWTELMMLLLFAVLSEPRPSRRKTVILTVGFGVLLSAVNHTALFLIGPQRYLSITFLSFLLPNALYCFLISKYWDGRFFLTFFLAFGLYTEVVAFTDFLKEVWTAGGYAAMLLLRLILYPALVWAAYRWLREPYRAVQRRVKANWTVLAVTAGMLYLVLYLMWSVPHVILVDSPAYLAALLLVMLLMPLVYWVIFHSLLRQWELSQSRERERLLESEAAALTSRIEQTAYTERQLAIARHDLRHRFQALDAMLARDGNGAAREYIAASVEGLMTTETKRWCADPVLDAVFSSYFSAAEAEGIHIEADLDLPETLPVDVTMISTVFANALENAIHAVKRLPPERRVIRCKCIHFPQFMFRVSNPYVGDVRFDEDGRPLAAEGGHGIGTASIAAYCEKYGAYCDYIAEDGWFTIQIIQP